MKKISVLQCLVGISFQFFHLDPTLSEKFWLVHGIIRVHPLSEGILQVIEFLSNSQDIIIWHTGGFDQVIPSTTTSNYQNYVKISLFNSQQWTDDAYNELISLLTTSFSDWWVKPSSTDWKKTLNQVWDDPSLVPEQGRIILTFNVRNTDHLRLLLHF